MLATNIRLSKASAFHTGTDTLTICVTVHTWVMGQTQHATPPWQCLQGSAFNAAQDGRWLQMTCFCTPPPSCMLNAENACSRRLAPAHYAPSTAFKRLASAASSYHCGCRHHAVLAPPAGCCFSSFRCFRYTSMECIAPPYLPVSSLLKVGMPNSGAGLSTQ